MNDEPAPEKEAFISQGTSVTAEDSNSWNVLNLPMIISYQLKPNRALLNFNMFAALQNNNDRYVLLEPKHL